MQEKDGLPPCWAAKERYEITRSQGRLGVGGADWIEGTYELSLESLCWWEVELIFHLP